MPDIFIVSAVRTPIGSFGGKLASLSAIELGAIAIKGAMKDASLDGEDIDEVIMGNVISANLGQAPARQAAIHAGISKMTPCTTVNKVCSSGMKSVMYGAQSIALGQADLVMTGGMESMSNAPFYVPKARYGHHYGHGQLIDGLLHDGLWEPYHQFPMGNCADNTAKVMNISRAAQDQYAIESYQRSQKAQAEGIIEPEIVKVTVPQKRGDDMIISSDEECHQVKFEKIPQLRPVFSKDGTVTAANASTINDGAAAILLASKKAVEKYGLKPMAKILGYADAAQEPLWFTTAPSLAIPKAMKMAGIEKDQVDYYEINEAFAAVALANMKLLAIDIDQTNVLGGAVSLGHPLGCSGARILCTLNNILNQRDATIGVAGICNGGGGASALVIERIN